MTAREDMPQSVACPPVALCGIVALLLFVHPRAAYGRFRRWRP